MSAIIFPNNATPAGSTAYYVCRSASVADRDRLAAIFEFRQTLFDLYAISDPGVARLKLQWWQQQLLQKQTGSTHPLVESLTPLLADNNSLQDQLELLFEAVDYQLHRQHYADTESLIDSASSIGGALALMIGEIGAPPSNEKARQAGTFILLVEWLQQLGRLTRQNIHLLPDDLLVKHRIDRQRLLSENDQHAVIDALIDLASQIHSDSRFTGIRPARGPIATYFKLRKKLFSLLENEKFDVMHQRISLTPLSKAWTAFW